ncbi:ABC transporter permease [Vibrio sp. SCSIO 43137]|uniref:ABC transporter permease n=1 Tax=Vibrio sp. SCSIO 43137 TaxID=3021011 RepID=UPI00230801E4|nr:ABC transporter permease [Vibrio sp. SCSIO 43137]WCE28836.1 ABC transporter permease [Vibrio sp. SCSIO 43137]
MNVLFFIVKRTLATIPLLFAISIASFAIIVAVPGDYVDAWVGQAMSVTGQSYEELQPQAEAMRKELGLDKSLPVQYLYWIKGIIFHGDFGLSFAQNRPVTEVIGLRLPRTIGLAMITLIVGQGVGIVLGIYAAVYQYKLGDTLATLIAFLGIVIPKFVMSLIILYFLAFVWHSPYIGSLYSPEYMLQEHFSFGKLWDFFLHTWPILLISIWAGQAYTTRMMRGNLLDVMKMQYIETARAKGLTNNRVLFKHAVPNALHPVIMNLGSRFDYMIKGEIEIAIVLGIPTLGPLILSSVSDRDMYVVSAIFMLVAMLLVIGNLIADLLLAVLDPRIRNATMTRK